MKLIPEFLAGIALPDASGGGAEDSRPTRRRRPERDGPHADLQHTATARTTGRSARSCSSGRGIKGNRVIGATDEKQFHVPLDPQTLACDRQKGIRVRPEHIHAALRDLAGIADHPFSRRFPLGVAENERLRRTLGLTRR